MIFSQSELLDDARTKGFGVQDGRVLTDLELLTELQHFGAATCLLDFTEDPLVALYMACKDLDTKDGQVYVLPDAGLDVAFVDSEIDVVIEKSRPLKFIPHMQGSAERRIIRQSGVFIIGLDDQYERLTHVCIASVDKENILKELASIYQISDETIFIDLSGFANARSAEKRLQSHFISFYEGLNFHKAGLLKSDSQRVELLKRAIETYNKALELKPDFAEAYHGRGLVKVDLGQHEAEAAKEDLIKARELFQNQSRPNEVKMVDGLLQSLGNDPEGSKTDS